MFLFLQFCLTKLNANKIKKKIFRLNRLSKSLAEFKFCSFFQTLIFEKSEIRNREMCQTCLERIFYYILLVALMLNEITAEFSGKRKYILNNFTNFPLIIFIVRIITQSLKINVIRFYWNKFCVILIQVVIRWWFIDIHEFLIHWYQWIGIEIENSTKKFISAVSNCICCIDYFLNH